MAIHRLQLADDRSSTSLMKEVSRERCIDDQFDRNDLLSSRNEERQTMTEPNPRHEGRA